MRLTVRRADPDAGIAPHYETYEVPEYEGMTVLDALLWAREHQDASLGCRFACRNANACKTCTAVVNGERTCTVPARGAVTVEPLPGRPFVRDLVVELPRQVDGTVVGVLGGGAVGAFYARPSSWASWWTTVGRAGGQLGLDTGIHRRRWFPGEPASSGAGRRGGRRPVTSTRRDNAVRSEAEAARSAQLGAGHVHAVHKDTYHQVKQELRGLVERLARAGRTQLPPEDELSAELGVSRPTVRSALLSLQKEGRIKRIHGRGTFINRRALSIVANVAEDVPFVDLLDALGYQASVHNLAVALEPMPVEAAGALEAQPGEDTCVVRRRFEASGEPAVLSFDYVPARLLTRPVGEVDGEASTFAFIHRWTQHRMSYSVAEIVPVVPAADIALALRVAGGTPLIRLSHTHIDLDDQPVGFTHAYVNSAYIRFSVIRTYTDA